VTHRATTQTLCHVNFWETTMAKTTTRNAKRTTTGRANPDDTVLALFSRYQKVMQLDEQGFQESVAKHGDPGEKLWSRDPRSHELTAEIDRLAIAITVSPLHTDKGRRAWRQVVQEQSFDDGDALVRAIDRINGITAADLITTAERAA
jgi:hypothetical protein